MFSKARLYVRNILGVEARLLLLLGFMMRYIGVVLTPIIILPIGHFNIPTMSIFLSDSSDTEKRPHMNIFNGEKIFTYE